MAFQDDTTNVPTVVSVAARESVVTRLDERHDYHTDGPPDVMVTAPPRADDTVGRGDVEARREAFLADVTDVCRRRLLLAVSSPSLLVVSISAPLGVQQPCECGDVAAASGTTADAMHVTTILPSAAVSSLDEPRRFATSHPTSRANTEARMNDHHHTTEKGPPFPFVLPFRYDSLRHRGIVQTLKMILVGLVLFVPRMVLLILSLFMTAALSSLALCCCCRRSSASSSSTHSIPLGHDAACGRWW